MHEWCKRGTWVLLLAATGVQAEGGMEGGGVQTWLAAERLEYQARDGHDAVLWDLQGWTGGDLHKAWIKAEGERLESEGTESSELQGLYSRAVLPYWDLQVGLRHDFRPGPSRSYAVIGLQGLAPYRFEVDAAAFVSEEGDISLRAESEYDLLITQRLILQPRLEVNIAFSDVPELEIGSGFTDVEAGLRLRYEIYREFAPYVGIEYARLLGDTGDLAKRAGEDAGGWSMVFGLRAWF